MECLTCPTGGVSADGTCAVPVCKMNDATNTVYHCNNCGNDNNCATCANGYYLASVRKYKLCRPCSPLCKTCANENEDECIECAVGKATPEKLAHRQHAQRLMDKSAEPTIIVYNVLQIRLIALNVKMDTSSKRLGHTTFVQSVTALAIHALDR